MTKYCVLDTETTGLFDFSKPADGEGQPRMASIAMIYLDEMLNVEREIHTLISPDGWEMDPNSEAAKITGLTTARLIDEGVPVHAALDEYISAVKEERVFVAHNSQYDLKVLRGELRRAGIPDLFENTKNICTMRGLTDVVKAPKANGSKGWKFPKLSEAMAHFGGASREAHNALSDAQDCVFLFRKMVEMDLVPEAKVHYAKNKTGTANERVEIGDNNPPAGYEAVKIKIEDLYDEAKLWLDGAVVDNEDLAKGINNLRNLLKGAGAEAEKIRVAEKEPFLEGGRAVDAKFRPLSEKVKRADEACASALKPWLLAKENERKDEAERLRVEADQAAAAARSAHIAASGNIAGLQQAEGLIKEAKAAERVAQRAETSTATVASDFGRSAKLKTIYSPVLLNFQAALDHYVTTRPSDVKALLESMAEIDVKAGIHKIPGFVVSEEKKVA